MIKSQFSSSILQTPSQKLFLKYYILEIWSTIYDILSAITKQLKNYDCRYQKKSNFLLNLSSWVDNLVFTRDLLLIAVTKKVFQGFPKFPRSEYLIFRPVNKTLFTPACSLLDNSFCLYIYSYYMLSRVFSNWFLKNGTKFDSNAPKTFLFKAKINYYFTHY